MVDWYSVAAGAVALGAIELAITIARRIRSRSDKLLDNGDMKPSDDPKFDEFAVWARKIKRQLVDPNREWYKHHLWAPFFLFRFAGVLTILLSVTLPVVSAIDEKKLLPMDKTYLLAGMSLGIAALTGLGGFFRWERTWRSRNFAKFSIDGLVAKWELELENARIVVEPKDRIGHAYRATNDLLTNFRNVGSEESEQFFSGLQFPQSNTTGGKQPP